MLRILIACSLAVTAIAARPNPPGALAEFAVSFVTGVLVEPLEIPDPIYDLSIPGLSPGAGVWNVDVVVRSHKACCPGLLKDELRVHISYFSDSKTLQGFTVEGPALAAQMRLPQAERDARRALILQRLAAVGGWTCASPTKELREEQEHLAGVCKDAGSHERKTLYLDNDVVPTLAGATP